MSNPDQILVGRTITGIKLAEDKKAILFQTDQGNVIAKCDGDCCSSTWIEHVELPALGLPAVVLECGEIDMPSVPQPEDGAIKAYGFKITTGRGEIVLDYRNESNGYYGGSLVWPEEDYFYGGVFGQNVSKEEWAELTTSV